MSQTGGHHIMQTQLDHRMIDFAAIATDIYGK